MEETLIATDQPRARQLSHFQVKCLHFSLKLPLDTTHVDPLVFFF